jgi:hypothetical protein
MADMVASVPELTIRETSMEGISLLIVSAIFSSAAHGVPNESPFSMASATAFLTAG